MKTIIQLTIALFITGTSVQAQAQADTCKTDSTKMRFRNFDVLIVERNKCNVEPADTASQKKRERKVKEKFSSWNGVYLGVNGFMTPSGSTSLGAGNKFLELDYSKSVTFGINFAEIKFKIVPKYVGLTTGMGIQWNKYGLKNNYNLFYNSDSVYGVSEPTINYRKNKLSATYLNIPLLLEFKTHAEMRKAFHIAVGVIGAYKLGSNLKQEYEANGFETHGKTKGHYQLNPFQLYGTVRLGFGKRFEVFANYGFSPVFESGRGPNLRPFTVGIYLPL